MCYFDLGIAEALMELKWREAQERAERSRVTVIAKAARMQNLPGQGIRLIRQTGRTLSALGQRLEQAGMSRVHTSP